MISLLLYLLKSTVSLGVFYLLFRLLMRRDTNFAVNRSLLIAFVVASVIVPLVQLPQMLQAPVKVELIPDFSENRIQLQNISETGQSTLKEESNPVQGATPESNPFDFSLADVLAYVYLGGVMLSFFLLAKNILAILLIFRKATVRQMDGYRLFIVKKEVPSFAFGHSVVISLSDFDLHGEAILAHEQSHIRLNHFYDLLLLELVKIFHWFNPAIYGLINDLKEIHEFQADDQTIQSGVDVKHYQLLIIQKGVGPQRFALANSFNHCQIKKRIIMMNKSKTRKAWSWKVATFLPLLALLLMAFGKTGENAQKNSPPGREMLNQEKTIVIESATQDRDSIYSTPEVMPQFPGGEEALRKFINENIHYSETKLKEYFKGKVLLEKGFVTFIVNSQGKVTNIKLVKSINNELDSAALRAILLMPDWIPAKDKGKHVSASYTLPMNWILWDVKTSAKQPPPPSPFKDKFFIFLKNDGKFRCNAIETHINENELAEKVKSELQKNPKLQFDILIEEGKIDERVDKITNILKVSGNPKVHCLSFHEQKETDNKGEIQHRISSKPMDIK